MKTINLKMTAISLGLLYSMTGFCQVTLDEAKKYLDVPGGVQSVDKKVLKEPSPQAFPYIALRFRTGSAELLTDGKGKEASSAKTYAVLDGIDSTLFQEITNDFAKLFEQKLKDAGVTVVELSKIKETKSYKKFTEEVSNRNFDHKDYGTAHVYTQDNTPFFYYPTGAMKVAKYVGDCEGGAAYLRLTVDFVEFDLNVSKSYGWDVTTTNFSAKAFPVVKVTGEPYAEGTWDMATGANKAGGLTMMDHKKYFSAYFNQLKPIYEAYQGKVDGYNDKLPKFATKKYRVFGSNAPQLGTFVIDAERDSFKKAAMKALTKYADCVVEIIKSYNTK